MPFLFLKFLVSVSAITNFALSNDLPISETIELPPPPIPITFILALKKDLVRTSTSGFSFLIFFFTIIFLALFFFILLFNFLFFVNEIFFDFTKPKRRSRDFRLFTANFFFLIFNSFFFFGIFTWSFNLNYLQSS